MNKFKVVELGPLIFRHLVVLTMGSTSDKAEQLSRQVDTLASAVSQASSLPLLQQGQEQQPLDFNPLKLLSALRAFSNAPSLQDLIQSLEDLVGKDVNPEAFLKAVTLFKDRGLISVKGKPGKEKVKFTTAGREFINLYGRNNT